MQDFTSFHREIRTLVLVNSVSLLTAQTFHNLASARQPNVNSLLLYSTERGTEMRHVYAVLMHGLT